ncbi:tRNA (uracil(54)-C(5))-methyltransferase homolog-B isoform X4 [Scyliorhinus canicula]|uniref:tRNA (uracil(54)-C(5))-methyltransferase homolog-B isoform X4 n=1 Tax=Scyliorhinus canicula TaxID=7830 RepID=UPI0018F501F8|nr:tRNA (uracil(54)-C(5))-methyltransferase homolog-B isoform X4 [Scyliorhinus canicula]
MSAASLSRLLGIGPQLISRQLFCFHTSQRCCTNVTFGQSLGPTTAAKQENVRKHPPKIRKSGKTAKFPSTNVTWEERLADAVTPLWRMNYEEQLQDYEQFIRHSPLDPCILFHEGGHWREITVRTNRKGDTMAIVYFHPQDLGKEEIRKHQKSLVEYFTTGPGAACELTSLYFQESAMTRCLHEESPYQLLYGIPYIFEEVLGLTFRISPDAFFQVNTEGAEVLYQTVRDLIRASGDYIVLDVCCGTGAVGLTVCQGAARVIGIELIDQAVEDAQCNAVLNGIDNCEFLKGKAEIVLPELLPSLEGAKFLVAVVNPSRAGLHYRVVRAIRNCEQIRRLVYISCKPEGEAMRNFVELCCLPDQQKKLFGDPFTPTLAVPVDMFPHTPHCELVLLFER